MVVLSGKDAGKRARSSASSADLQRRERAHRAGTAAGSGPLAGVSVVVEGLNIAKRHTKPRQTQGRTDRAPKIQQGGILDIAQPIDVSR